MLRVGHKFLLLSFMRVFRKWLEKGRIERSPFIKMKIVDVTHEGCEENEVVYHEKRLIDGSNGKRVDCESKSEPRLSS